MRSGSGSARRELRNLESDALRLWPAALAVVLISCAYAGLPDALREGPRWLLAVVAGVLLLVTAGTHRRGYRNVASWLGRAVTALVTVALIASVLLLVLGLEPSHIRGAVLLRYAGLLWAINIGVFALWYWEIDNDGPHARHANRYAPIDFAFPQYQMFQPGDEQVHWKPGFVDYVFLAFNMNTAFSPSDTMIMSWRAKLLMMTQATIALVVLTLLAARAISLL